MKFSHNWLKDYIKGRLPKPEKLAEVLTLHAFEVESVTKQAGDYVLDIDVLPNRAGDCLSHIGIARECAAILNLKFKIANCKFKESRNLKVNKFLRVEVKDKNLCPRYTARVITDVKVKESPKLIKRRLLACGIKPINNVVDATNYVMLETGQPLHAFDFNKLEPARGGTRRIIIRKAAKGEKITILDGGEYELDGSVLVIADSKEPLAIAGIKGGKKAEIDKDTQVIALESANFNPLAIRAASKKLGIKSDASGRFEAELDPNMTEWALDKVASLVQAQARGKVVRGATDIYSKKKKPLKIKLNLEKVKDLLGMEVPRQKIKNTFVRLGLKVKEHRFNLEVEIPTWRGDLNIEEDLIEEIVRLYGYNKVSSQMPEVQLAPLQKDISLFWEAKIKDILVGAGFSEVYNYSFVNNADLTPYKNQRFSTGQAQISNADKTLIKIANPISANQGYLRPTLTPNLLVNIKENLKNFAGLKIFELGKIYHQAGGEIQEKKSLTGAVVGGSPRTFYRAKGVVELLLNKLGIQNFNIQPLPSNIQHLTSNIQHWHPGRTAEIAVGRKVLGAVGEVHPELKAKYDISAKVILFELNPGLLIELANPYKTYKPVYRYPTVTLDLAVIMNKGFTWANIKKEVLKEGGRVIENIKLFDIYKGKGIPKGKISFAFHVVYRAEDRTLTASEAKRVHEKITRVLEGMGGEVRR